MLEVASDTESSPSFPSLRGGAGGATVSLHNRQSRLLDVLTKCLADFESDKTDNGEQDLLHELEGIVRRRPRNLLQELKSLVTKYTKMEHDQRRSSDSAEPPSWSNVARSRTNAARVQNAGKPPPLKRPMQSSVGLSRPKKPVEARQVGRLRPGDWPCDVVRTPDELEDVLAKSGKAVLHPSCPDDAPEMWAMLGSFPKASATLILHEESATEQYDGGSVSTVRVPLLVNGNIVMTKVQLVMKGPDAPSFAVSSVGVKTRKQDDKSCALRASTHKGLVHDFDQCQINPGSQCRAWVHGVKLCNARQVGDSWGWRLSGPTVTGLIRVELDAVPALLKASGQRCQQSRWFFEPMRFESPLPKPFDQLPETQWVRNSDLTLEQRASLAEQEAKKSGLGVRLGDKQVGVRVVRPQVSAASKSKVWKATAVPRSWQLGDVEDAMTEAGFQDFEPLEKFRWRESN